MHQQIVYERSKTFFVDCLSVAGGDFITVFAVLIVFKNYSRTVSSKRTSSIFSSCRDLEQKSSKKQKRQSRKNS